MEGVEDVQGGVVRAGAPGLDRDTVHKMLEYPVPLGYRRRPPPRRPKLDPYRGVIDRILEEDRSLPKNQRHTAKRIYERLRAEYGFGGKYTIVKDYVRERRRRTREMYVPLSHPPGDAQRDFGQAKAVIGGVEQTVHYFVLDLPHSDACVVKAYPAETTEAFCDGHVSAFSFLGGVPRSILYDNTRLAVARILGDGRRRRTRVFSELQSHYLFEDRFGRPGKGPSVGTRSGAYVEHKWMDAERIRTNQRQAHQGWGRGIHGRENSTKVRVCQMAMPLGLTGEGLGSVPQFDSLAALVYAVFTT